MLRLLNLSVADGTHVDWLQSETSICLGGGGEFSFFFFLY